MYHSQIISTVFDIDAIQENRIVIGTGYSLYWFIISFCFIYDLKK